MKAVHLTFDDQRGPIPEITHTVGTDLFVPADIKYNIKASFGGDNARIIKEFQMIAERDHRLGNHT